MLPTQNISLYQIKHTNYIKQRLTYLPTAINQFPSEAEYYLPQKCFKSKIKKHLIEQTK